MNEALFIPASRKLGYFCISTPPIFLRADFSLVFFLYSDMRKKSADYHNEKGCSLAAFPNYFSSATNLHRQFLQYGLSISWHSTAAIKVTLIRAHFASDAIFVLAVRPRHVVGCQGSRPLNGDDDPYLRIFIQSSQTVGRLFQSSPWFVELMIAIFFQIHNTIAAARILYNIYIHTYVVALRPSNTDLLFLFH